MPQRIEAAADLVHNAIGSSPQISWPLLSQRIGTETWVKHENQTPTGAFKVRGGLVYVAALARHARAGEISGIVAASELVVVAPMPLRNVLVKLPR